MKRKRVKNIVYAVTFIAWGAMLVAIVKSAIAPSYQGFACIFGTMTIFGLSTLIVHRLEHGDE